MALHAQGVRTMFVANRHADRARSIADSTDRSQGWITIRCGSGVLMPAIWFRGVGVP